MRIDYRNAFPAGVRARAELERSVRSDVLSLDGLDLPAEAAASAGQ